MHCTHLTASRIKTYKDCAFRYALEYHIQLPSMRDGNIYSEKGSAVHLALERYANAILGEEEEAELDYEKTLREYYADSRLWELDNRLASKGGHPHPQPKMCEVCPHYDKDGTCVVGGKKATLIDGCPRPNFDEDLALIERTLSRTDYAPLATEEDPDGRLRFVNKILGVEKSFDMKLDGVRVRGKIDLVVEHDADTLEVIDYKTGRSMSFNAARKDPQVRTYGAVARILYPEYKYITVTLYYLKSGPVEVPLGIEDDNLTIQSLRHNYDKISSDNNPRNREIWLCKYCIGYDACKEVRRKFTKGGKFRLPTLSCEYANQGGSCWGNLHPIEGQEVAIEDIDKILYACRGHSSMHLGDGGYIQDDSDKAS